MRLWARNELTPDDPQHENTAAHNIDESLALFGLLRDGATPAAPADQVFLWPDNTQTWALWLRVQTQWRVGMGGRTGLDYAGVQACFAMFAVKAKDRPEIFSALQAMEFAALEVWAADQN